MSKILYVFLSLSVLFNFYSPLLRFVEVTDPNNAWMMGQVREECVLGAAPVQVNLIGRKDAQPKGPLGDFPAFFEDECGDILAVACQTQVRLVADSNCT